MSKKCQKCQTNTPTDYKNVWLELLNLSINYRFRPKCFGNCQFFADSLHEMVFNTTNN